MKQKISNALSIIIPLLLGLGLMAYSYKSFTDEQLAVMQAYFTTADYNYVLISLLLAVSGYVLRAYRWKYTLTQIGYVPDFKLNFLAVSIGYFVNLTIPRSGEVSRALILKKYQDIPFDKAFGTIIGERIVDFFILLFFIFLSLVVEFDTLKSFLLSYIPVGKLILILAIGLVGFLISLYLYFYSKWKIILNIKSKVEGLKEGALSIWKMPYKWEFLIYTLLIWFSYVLMFYAATFALKETSNITFGTALVAFVIGSLTITFTNGGFGFFPVLIAKILFLYNVPIEAGNAFGWIVWTSQLIITVFLGLFSLFALPFVRKNK
ncbi:lysylphosphatidylglycerol synthase transmembrane domain-containing protein [Flavobacterium soli]|uniref:lysylphosphatidylglycerol synthase transmembrane domain-containing protein n=1 Tax=Flavobacterium soli TaxID=344881 RepID=UPI0003FD3A03|nr:lysylphosphatidylglycerol synthase transmembrane domain-containing protein [Flavobacterium soli]